MTTPKKCKKLKISLVNNNPGLILTKQLKNFFQLSFCQGSHVPNVIVTFQVNLFYSMQPSHKNDCASISKSFVKTMG